MVEPVRQGRWHALWVGPVRFGRRFLFAALVGGGSYAADDVVLPVLIFVSLLGLLLLCVTLQPYVLRRDNIFELVCLLVLLYGYFSSVLQGLRPSSGVELSALLAKMGVVLYAGGHFVLRAAPRRCQERLAAAATPRSASMAELHTPLVDATSTVSDAEVPSESGSL